MVLKKKDEDNMIRLDKIRMSGTPTAHRWGHIKRLHDIWSDTDGFNPYTLSCDCDVPRLEVTYQRDPSAHPRNLFHCFPILQVSDRPGTPSQFIPPSSVLSARGGGDPWTHIKRCR